LRRDSAPPRAKDTPMQYIPPLTMAKTNEEEEVQKKAEKKRPGRERTQGKRTYTVTQRMA